MRFYYSQLAGATVIVAVCLLLYELKAHNSLHIRHMETLSNTNEIGRPDTDLHGLAKQWDTRLSSMEDAINLLRQDQSARLSNLSAAVTWSIKSVQELTNEVGSLTRTPVKERIPAESQPGTTLKQDETTLPDLSEWKDLPLPMDFQGKFDKSCCNFELVRQRIDRVQNSTCGDHRKRFIVKFHLTSHGFGVDLMGNIANVVFARATTRALPFQIIGKSWHYSKGVCPAEDLSCYFKPIDPTCDNSIVPYTFGEPVKDLCCSKDRLQYFAYLYITQPLDKYIKLSRQRAATLTVPKDEPCAAMHVRRGDSLLNKGYGGKGAPVYRNVSVQEYLDKSRDYLEHFQIKHILLMSDDADAMIEAKAIKKYTWHSLERKRLKSTDNISWEGHFPTGNRENEVIDIFALRDAVKQCSMFIGSQSQFGITLWKGVMADNDAPYVFVETRARNLLFKDEDPRQLTVFDAPPFAANHGGRTYEQWKKSRQN